MGVQGSVAVDLAVDGLRVRVKQQLRRVAAMSLGGIVRTVHPEAVALSRLDGGNVTVPDMSVDLGELDPGLGAGPTN